MRLRSSKSHPIGKAYLQTDDPTLKIWHRPGRLLLTIYYAKLSADGVWLVYVKTGQMTHDTEFGNFVMKSSDLRHIADAFDLPLHKP